MWPRSAEGEGDGLEGRIFEEILEILERSPVAEDPAHARNVLEWVRRIKPGAGFALKVAALGHDLERACTGGPLRREDFANYDEFKRAHARRSAEEIARLLAQFGVDEETVQRAAYLVRHHEHGVEGGEEDEELTILKDADSLSFFEINASHYHAREGEEATLARMRWGYARLSKRGRVLLSRIVYREGRLEKLLRSARAGRRQGVDPSTP